MTSGSSDEASIKVSVVIPTYNRCDLLAKTLDQFTRQRMPADEFEIIVSDDGSSDATEAVTKSFHGRLRVKYSFQEDLGFRAGAARNSGARLAAAPVLVFVDTGVMVGPDFLRHHLAAHGEGDNDGGHVVLGYAYGWKPPGVPPLPGLVDALSTLPAEEVVERFKDNHDFFDERHAYLEEMDFDLSRYLLPWPLFLSLNFSVLAADFWAVGGFDEEFRGWGFEDLELAYRLFWHGLSFRMSREAWAVEWPHERDAAKNMQESAVNLQRFRRKHRDPSVEIFRYAGKNTSMWASDRYYRELAAWRDQVRGMDAETELAEAARRFPPGNRIVVVGCGGRVPASLAGATLMDFDEDLLRQALSAGRNTGLHAIGLWTPLPDQSVDTVIITSRLTGLWERMGDDLMEEARRIGRNVYAPGQAGA
jgi:glycosyltransferase involved in cell wall biosynthesis